MIDIEEIKSLLSVKDGILRHRESQTLEFKESFNFAGLAEYFRDFAAFANNKGGYLIFGVVDRPKRELKGLSKRAIEQFDKLDPEKISGYLLDSFSGLITWEHEVFDIDGMLFAVFKVSESAIKPIICKKDDGRDGELRNGDIYFRYGGRSQRIQHSELENIIQRRLEMQNAQWMDLVNKIGKSGPQNAAILDVDKGTIKKNDSQILVVDEELVRNIKWIKEGSFKEKEGAAALKLVGTVQPIDTVEVVKTEKINRLREYPLSATQVAQAVKEKIQISTSDVWRIINENDIKNLSAYSIYNFRNKSQEDEYENTGKIAKGVPSIYKVSVVDYIVQIYQNENR